MKFAFFDAKSYDKVSFDKYGNDNGIEFKYFETKLNEDTASLAKGYDGVCAFVNDDLSAPVIDKLYELGINIIAMRCAGYNNVDLKHANGKISVVLSEMQAPVFDYRTGGENGKESKI